MPFTPNGAQGIQIASWSSARGLHLLTGLNTFPNKYLRFVIGMHVNNAQNCMCTSTTDHKCSAFVLMTKKAFLHTLVFLHQFRSGNTDTHVQINFITLHPPHFPFTYL